ncbi:hypothetical protein TCAL_13974, partial [Tigriopus californicus]
PLNPDPPWNSTSTPVCLAALLALVFIASGGIRPVDASGYFGRRVLFVPITSPTSDDTCAADYANKDKNELELLENGLFNQEFLESVGVGNKIKMCSAYISQSDPTQSVFRVMSFQIQSILRALKI